MPKIVIVTSCILRFALKKNENFQSRCTNLQLQSNLDMEKLPKICRTPT